MRNTIKHKKKIIVTFSLFTLISLTALACWLVVPHHSVLAQRTFTPDSEYNERYAKNYIHFKTSDGEVLSGWFFNRGRGTQLVVCCPGNSCNAGMFTDIASRDTDRSYLMLNYRGYGGSTGHLREANMVSDVREAVRHYTAELQTSDITLLGFSLGTGVVVQAVIGLPEVEKIVLVAPFDSMLSVCQSSLISRCILKDHFNSIDYAPNVKCPVYVLYSEDDRVVLPQQTRRLISAFAGEVHAEIGVGSHTDLITLPENLGQVFRLLQKNSG